MLCLSGYVLGPMTPDLINVGFSGRCQETGQQPCGASRSFTALVQIAGHISRQCNVDANDDGNIVFSWYGDLPGHRLEGWQLPKIC